MRVEINALDRDGIAKAYGKAANTVVKYFLTVLGLSSSEEARALGFAIYNEKKKDSSGGYYWIGYEKDENGYKASGGLFRAQYFKAALEMDISSERVIGTSGESYRSLKIVISSICREELIDKLYEKLKEHEKEQA